MNEEKKNIETCLPENILAEVASVPTDPQFRSLVNESLDPLKQQALQQAGSDAYKEVVMYHQPYTFTSSVRQMKSNLILLLRRLWRFPFGTGTIRSLSDADTIPSLSDAAPRSLADMWAHYITRLSGNPESGIPSRLSQLTDLPSAPLLVADRKISGVPDAVDGMSLLHLLNDLSGITELTDDNVGWTWTRMFPTFANLTKLQMGCAYIVGMTTALPTTLEEIEFDELLSYGLPSGDLRPLFIYNNPNITELRFRKMKAGSTGFTYGTADSGCFISTCSALKKVYFDDLEAWGKNLPGHGDRTNDAYCCLIHSCANLEEVYMPKWTGVCNWRIISNCPKVWKVVLGTITSDVPSLYGSTAYPFSGMVNLYHLEIAGCTVSLDLQSWNPTTALANNLQQFLSNFRSFIVLRLANRKTTSALTLTLSANVYNAVTGANSGWASQHTLAELGITDNDLTDLETELGITSATIYATWLDTYTGANGIHWDINKAN